jgi:iron complex transport system substrate-binding protein
MAERLTGVGRCLFVLLLLAASGGPARASRRITDEVGRIVVVPDHPHRIVCLTPSLTQTVYELGAGDLIVGVSDYTTSPAEASTKPSVGAIIDPSMERIVSLQPDLIFLAAHLNRQETISHLEDLKVPAFVVDPQGLDGVLKMIQSVGNAINRDGEAQSLVKRLTEKRAVVTRSVNGLARPKVFVVIWYDPVLTAGKQAFITDVISAAGADSVTANIPQPWPQISMEDVLKRAPDFLLLIKELHGGITLDLLKSRPGWDRLEAVRNAHVITVDEKLEMPSPLVFDALEELAKMLHPAAFAER